MSRTRFTSGRHPYHGRRNSRGQRSMSKIHKGVVSGDIERAFQEVEKLTRIDWPLAEVREMKR